MNDENRVNLIKEYANANVETQNMTAEYERKAAIFNHEAILIVNKQHELLKSLAMLMWNKKNFSEVEDVLSKINDSLKLNLDHISDIDKARIDIYNGMAKVREKELELLEMQMANVSAAKRGEENANHVSKRRASELLTELKLMMDLAPLSTTKCEIQGCMDKIIRDNLEWIKTFTKTP